MKKSHLKELHLYTIFAVTAFAAAFTAGPASGDILPPPKGGYFASNVPGRKYPVVRPDPPRRPRSPESENLVEDVFRTRAPGDLERDTLHSSLTRIVYLPVFSFKSEDGTLAGRVDELPTRRLGDWDPDNTATIGKFDDPLALFRIALFDTPVRSGQKPKTVFYATRRVEGTSGTHSFVDVTWWHALRVDVTPHVPAGKANAEWEPSDGADISIELVRYPVASPEAGLAGESRKFRLARWSEIVVAPPDPDF